jgi:hypothetical protein
MSYGNMQRDTSGVPMPVFSPKKVVTVTISVAWEPDTDDRAFMSTEDVNLVITTDTGSAQSSVPIPAHLPFGIIKGFTYTFDAAAAILVM